MKALHRAVAVGALFISLFAQAQGSGAHGGGSIVKLKNQFALSEIFLMNGVAGERLQLTPELTKLLTEVRSIFEIYTGAKLDRFWDEVYGAYADYRLKEKLPCIEKDSIRPSVLGQQSRYVGCTQNGVTYLHPKNFESLDTLSKVMTLVHERAHTFEISADAHERWIYPLVQGMYVLLKVRLEQEQSQWRILQAHELRALRALIENREIYRQLKDRAVRSEPTSVKVITPHGGGFIYFDTETDAKFLEIKNSFVTLDSKVVFSRRRCGWNYYNKSVKPFEARIVNRTLIRNSTVECVSLANSLVYDSSIRAAQIFKQVFDTIQDSSFVSSTLQIMSDRLTIEGSHFYHTFLTHDLTDIEMKIVKTKFYRSDLDYTSYMQDYRVWGEGMIEGDMIVRVIGRTVTQSRNLDGSKEGHTLRAKRKATPFDDVHFHWVLGGKIFARDFK